MEIFGPDLSVLETKAKAVEAVLGNVRGIGRIAMVHELGQPSLTIAVDRAKIARYGVNVEDVNALIEAAVGGVAATQVVQGEKSFDLVVRLRATLPGDTRSRSARSSWPRPRENRCRFESWRPSRCRSGASYIYREDNSRFIGVQYAVVGRDLASAVEDAQHQVAATVKLPAGLPDRLGWGIQGVHRLAQPAGSRPAADHRAGSSSCSSPSIGTSSSR